MIISYLLEKNKEELWWLYDRSLREGQSTGKGYIPRLFSNYVLYFVQYCINSSPSLSLIVHECRVRVDEGVQALENDDGSLGNL